MQDHVKKARSPRSAARISPKLDNNLAAYMAAASAAGVGLLAAAQSAEAKVVYTPANVTLTRNSSYGLDLNNDGIIDFELSEFFTQFARFPLGDHTNVLDIRPRSKQANRVIQATSNSAPYAAALPARTQVGPNGPFQPGYSSHVLAFSGGSSGSTFQRGPWFTHPKAYLGVKFIIDGQTHYGWVRITVSPFIETVTIVGYAYETVPNKPISTGQTSGPVKVSAMSQPATSTHRPAVSQASLGVLARGAETLALWRRTDETVAPEWSEALA